jgi:hypothetical protein
MTMTPERFRELLDVGTADAPPAPPTRIDLEAGHTRLRRQRVATAVAAALAVVVVAGGVGLATRTGTEDRGIEPIVTPSQAVDPTVAPPLDPPRGINAEAVLRDCRSDDLPPGYFDGQETVPIARATDYQTVAAIQSADGRYWASCTILLHDSEDIPTPQLHDSQGTTGQGLKSSLGPGCSPATSKCLYYQFSAVDRVQGDVAAVQFELSDGTTATEQTKRGFYVINVLQRLPEGASVDDQGRLVGLSALDVIHQVTYLDATGQAIAAERFDGSGGGPNGAEVDGLPPLSTYPSLNGDF